MKFYVTANEVRTYQIVVEAKDDIELEEYIKENEDFIISTLKENVSIRDFGEVYIELADDESGEEIKVDFTI
jgi:hypothetical protein